MYISKIALKNFKGFSGEHEIILNKGINFFVGNNNCGKTTIFKAVDFILSKGNKEDYITKGVSGEVSVELEFKGDDIGQLVELESLKKYQNYVIDEGGEKSLRILRSSEENEITQLSDKGKETKKSFNIKNVRVYNPTTNQFENPTGIDTTISALFDAQFVYSDLKNEDYQDFGKTKIIGKIINSVTKEFQNTPAFRALEEAHEKAFGEEGLTRSLETVQNKIQDILSEQYGEAQVKFNFGLPEIDNFFKTGEIMLSDNGITTCVEEKGTGMQRALALSLIQVYAEISNQTDEDETAKPILFFLDEPETFLHPKAQNRLLDSLEKLAQNSQIFITTHSPYLLKKFDRSNHQISIFSKDALSNKVENKEILNLFGDTSPTWGEINHFAFGVESIEFHNELYGFLQQRAMQEDISNYFEKEFENWLVSKGLVSLKNKYVRLFKDGNIKNEDKTLQTFIRNVIHHPENTNNSYTESDLSKSITELINVITE